MPSLPLASILAAVGALTSAGCLDGLLCAGASDSNRCEEDYFARFGPLQPSSGPSNETHARSSYRCATAEMSIEDYLFSLHHGPPGPWDVEEYPWSSGSIALNASRFAVEDGGSFTLWILEENSTHLNEAPTDGTQASWAIRFDHWLTSGDNHSSLRPGIAISRDGTDEDMAPDPLPFGHYVWRLASRNGTATIVAECAYQKSPDHPGCEWWRLDRYYDDAEGRRVHHGWSDSDC